MLPFMAGCSGNAHAVVMWKQAAGQLRLCLASTIAGNCASPTSLLVVVTGSCGESFGHGDANSTRKQVTLHMSSLHKHLSLQKGKNFSFSLLGCSVSLVAGGRGLPSHPGHLLNPGIFKALPHQIPTLALVFMKLLL